MSDMHAWGFVGTAHECVFVEEQEPSGRLVLPPCIVCGTPAMDALDQLRGKQEPLVSRVVEDEAGRELGWVVQTKGLVYWFQTQAEAEAFKAKPTANQDGAA